MNGFMAEFNQPKRNRFENDKETSRISTRNSRINRPFNREAWQLQVVGGNL